MTSQEEILWLCNDVFQSDENTILSLAFFWTNSSTDDIYWYGMFLKWRESTWYKHLCFTDICFVVAPKVLLEFDFSPDVNTVFFLSVLSMIVSVYHIVNWTMIYVNHNHLALLCVFFWTSLWTWTHSCSVIMEYFKCLHEEYLLMSSCVTGNMNISHIPEWCGYGTYDPTTGVIPFDGSIHLICSGSSLT